jgi:hypothetical protein
MYNSKERDATIMTLQQGKLDITDRVVGKLENGEMVLYLENERIGKVSLPSGSNMQLEHHFENSGQKIFQLVSTPSSDEPRYTDCDEGGWC